jgi:hypothetical protein
MAFEKLKMIKMTRTVSKHGRGFIGRKKIELENFDQGPVL